jgi:hypothetical protein
MSPRGGYRPGAGRPKGEATAPYPVRLPIDKVLAYREAAARDEMTLAQWTETNLDLAVARTALKSLKK